ncbi:MAG: TM2 domain-containing protein [Firmicutes bacterium]|nr:TM2 domain-containing protein [Bacillota bacterium]
MYCKNCGNLMDDNAAICVKCGCQKGTGTSYCPNCGQPTVPGAACCTNCGVSLNVAPAGAAKSKLAAGLLGIFLGSLGVHNFYLGYIGKAVAQLLISLLSCGTLAIVSEIWGLIEGIMILTGKISVDKKGVPLKD